MRTNSLTLGRPDSTTTSVRRVQPPYLFADSIPFSHNFDFISVLESFVDLAADVLAEARGVRENQQEIARLRGELAKSVVALQRLENEIVERAVNVLFSQSDPTLEAVATRLDFVARDLSGRGRADLQARFDAQTAPLYVSIRECEARMAAAVARFFLKSELEVARERFSLSLTDDGYRVRLKQLVEGNITVRFEIDAQKTFWSQSRRVSDLVPGLRVFVGVRRKTFSRSLELDDRALGDYLIGRIRRDGDMMELGLRKKNESQESLHILLCRKDAGVTGQATHTDEPDVPFDIPDEHAERVAALWNALECVCVADKAARSQVARVSLGDKDVLHEQGAEELVDHLVAAYRPIVAELLDHGAASGELSLKRDLGDGRREERFATLSHLIKKVATLGPEERARLRGLGLDKSGPSSGDIALTQVRMETLPTRSDNANQTLRG